MVTKAKKALAPAVNATAVIGFNYRRSEDIALFHIEALQNDQDTARRNFIIGEMAADMFPEHLELNQQCYDAALVVFDMSGKEREKTGNKRLYDTARKAWSRLLQKTGINSNHGNAGNDNAGGVDNSPEPVEANDAPVVEKLPKVANDAMTPKAYYTLFADTLAALISKAKEKELRTEIPTAFVTRIEELRAEALKNIEE